MTTQNNVATVTFPANNVQKIETAFYTALGNGRLAATHMRDLIRAVSVSRDTTIISKALFRAKEKGDDKAASVLSLAMRETFVGAKVTKGKDGKFSIKIKGIEPDQKALDRLDSAVESKLSIRGDTFRKAITGEKVETVKAIDYPAKAARIVKDGVDIDLMIAALQALRGVNANAATE
jgi:hypothetical protein